MSEWITCRPINRESDRMMAFILRKCQELRQETYAKREEWKKKEVSAEDWKEAVIKVFLIQNPTAYDIPRYALDHSVLTVLKDPKGMEPERKQGWNSFSVAPREGWKKASTKRTQRELTWTDFMEGKTTEDLIRNDNRTVTPERAVTEILEEGKLSFRWGKVQMVGHFEEVLLMERALYSYSPESYLRHLQELRFAITPKGIWKVKFIVEKPQ